MWREGTYYKQIRIFRLKKRYNNTTNRESDVKNRGLGLSFTS
jgi:hypothetical protein